MYIHNLFIFLFYFSFGSDYAIIFFSILAYFSVDCFRKTKAVAKGWNLAPAVNKYDGMIQCTHKTAYGGICGNLHCRLDYMQVFFF